MITVTRVLVYKYKDEETRQQDMGHWTDNGVFGASKEMRTLSIRIDDDGSTDALGLRESFTLERRPEDIKWTGGSVPDGE